MRTPLNAAWVGVPRAIVPFVFACGLFIFRPFSLQAQVSTVLGPGSPTEIDAGQAAALTVPVLQADKVERIYLLYRPFGSSDYTQLEMEIAGSVASATIPARAVTPPFLEYYMVVLTRAGQLLTHPVSESQDPFSIPPANTLRLVVRAVEMPETAVLFLSPEPNSTITQDDALISISLLRADSTIRRQATRLFLDDADITTASVFSGDIIVYMPDMIEPGPHRVTVQLLKGDSTLAGTASLAFTVAGASRYAAVEAPAPAARFRYNGALQLESRHEQVREVGTWYNRGTLRLTGSLDNWRLTTNAFVTSDEEPGRQPQNRFFIGVESDWLKAGYGDSYPAFPDLILRGKRVRGLNSSLRLGFFNVDVALGKTVRSVEGRLLKSFPVDSLAVEFQRDSTAPYDRISSTHMGKFSYGSYARDLFVVRPSFGSGQTWQVGFTYLKSKDDVESIRFGVRPQENLVVGADFLTRFDDRRIELRGQAAFSAYNSDISSGTFTDAYIDTVFAEKDQGTIRQVRDLLGRYITVNDNLRPLSLKKPATISYDLTLALQYFDQDLRATYLFRGSDYHSFGQTYLRKDIRGFNILDRFRLLQNLVTATLGYERLEDNTTDAKVATTAYSTYTAALTYRGTVDIPLVSIGFNRFVNRNDLPTSGPLGASAVDDATNRFFLQSSYDFTMGVRHTATLDLSTSRREDNSLRNADVKNTALGLGINTRYAFPLSTVISVLMNFNSLPALAPGSEERSLDYTMLSIYGRYELVPGTIFVTATLSPTFGDFRRVVSDIGAEWRVSPSMAITGEFNHFQNEGAPNDNFVSMRYRYDL